MVIGRTEGERTTPTIRVEVTLKGTLAARLPGGRGPVEVAAGSTVEAILPALGIPRVHCVYVRNGAAVPRDATLSDGDRVLVYPPMAGGGPSASRQRRSQQPTTARRLNGGRAPSPDSMPAAQAVP